MYFVTLYSIKSFLRNCFVNFNRSLIWNYSSKTDKKILAQILFQSYRLSFVHGNNVTSKMANCIEEDPG